MKKLLMGSVALLCFAISLLIVQVSCSKSEAKPLDNPEQKKTIYLKVELSGKSAEIWSINYDGTEDLKIPVTFPTNVTIGYASNGSVIKVSPDGQTLFLQAVDKTVGYEYVIYSCNIDGSNLQEIKRSESILNLQDAY